MMIAQISMRYMWILALLAGMSFAWQSDCWGQVARYQPRSPTISPYLALTRSNVNGLSNYYAFVRPLIQQRAFNAQEQVFRGNQDREILRLQNEIQRGIAPAAATGTSSWFMIPGNDTKIMNTTGYFPQPNIRGRR